MCWSWHRSSAGGDRRQRLELEPPLPLRAARLAASFAFAADLGCDMIFVYEFDPATNVVAVYVGRLRAKIRKDVIQTVRNVGYQLQSA